MLKFHTWFAQVKNYNSCFVVGILIQAKCHNLAFSRVGTRGAWSLGRDFTYLVPENKLTNQLIHNPILRNQQAKYINNHIWDNPQVSKCIS